MAARRRKFGPSQKERIFLAALPDAEVGARIHALAETLKREYRFTGNLILPEHLHVTLFHLGDWAALPDEIVTLASGAASQVSIPAFDVTFKRAESFRNSTGVYPFVLTGDKTQWRGLHEALRVALVNAGSRRRDARRFSAPCHADLRRGAREAARHRTRQLDRQGFRPDPFCARQDHAQSSGPLAARITRMSVEFHVRALLSASFRSAR